MSLREHSMDRQSRDFMKIAYEEFWVPFFGRFLSLFIRWIEGKPPKENHTYDLRQPKD